MLRLTCGLFGALAGSFLNVAIHRWPRELSVLRPARSHCPSCGAAIPFYHNLPLVTYLLLRGRAACCGQKISPRYWVVEASATLLAIALGERLQPWALRGDVSHAAFSTLFAFGFACALLIAAFVDLEWMEIPDEVTIGGSALGLLSLPLDPARDPLEAAFGAGLGYTLVYFLFVWAYEVFRGRRGMGEGDAKLLMLIGVFEGWQGVLYALVAGSFQGLLLVLTLRLWPRRSEAAKEVEDEDWLSRKIPFGPFLALGALELLLFREPILSRLGLMP